PNRDPPVRAAPTARLSSRLPPRGGGGGRRPDAGDGSAVVLRPLQRLIRPTDDSSAGAGAGFAAIPRALLGLRAGRAVGSLDLALLRGVATPVLRASAAATDFTRCETRTHTTVPRVTTTERGKTEETAP